MFTFMQNENPLRGLCFSFSLLSQVTTKRRCLTASSTMMYATLASFPLSRCPSSKRLACSFISPAAHYLILTACQITDFKTNFKSSLEPGRAGSPSQKPPLVLIINTSGSYSTIGHSDYSAADNLRLVCPVVLSLLCRSRCALAAAEKSREEAGSWRGRRLGDQTTQIF